MPQRTTSLLAKPTPHNVNLGSDRFAMFNKERDIPPQTLPPYHPALVIPLSTWRIEGNRGIGASAPNFHAMAKPDTGRHSWRGKWAFACSKTHDLGENQSARF